MVDGRRSDNDSRALIVICRYLFRNNLAISLAK